MIASDRRWVLDFLLLTISTTSIFPAVRAAQEPETSNRTSQDTASGSRTETTEEYNRRLQEVLRLPGSNANGSTDDYRIGADDLLEVSVFEAPELNRTVRVSSGGEVTLPLLGPTHAAGLTPRELESVLQELLRRRYMNDPHVGVFLKEIESHPVSVIGAVKKAGVFQIRGAKSLIEILSLAEGLSDDAGDTVVVMHHPEPVVTAPSSSDQTAKEQPTLPVTIEESFSDTETAPKSVETSLKPAVAEQARVKETIVEPTGGDTLEINLKSLLDSVNPRDNVLVYPGDLVKVRRAGVIYVVGEVRMPGGFVLKTNENISVLQALALAQGLTRTSAKSRARIIRTDETTGSRTETPINLDRILKGKMADPLLRPKDIVFIPNSTGRSALYRSGEAAIAVGTGVAIYRR